MKKIEAEFPRSGIFPPNGMRTPSFQIYESYYAFKCSMKGTALQKEWHINSRNSRILLLSYFQDKNFQQKAEKGEVE